jgi:twinkle protein
MERAEEFLDKNVIRSDDMDFDKYLDNVEEARLIKPSSSYRDATKAVFNGEDDAEGLFTPWTNDWKIRPAELTIWTGYSGHKKSMTQGFLSLFLMRQYQKCLIASLEMPPRKTLYRMVKQFSGAAQPSEKQIDLFFDWASDKLWLFDKVGSVKPKTMLGVTAYAARELDCHQIFIDSLMKCGISEDNLNGQKRFVDMLNNIAMGTDTHIHLVAHSKKPLEDDKRPSTKYAVAGSANITNMADNVVVCFSRPEDTEAGEGEKEWHQALIVAKQRHGEAEPFCRLWFDKNNLQMRRLDKFNQRYDELTFVPL